MGTAEGLEARAVPARGFPIDFVSSGPVLGRGAAGVSGAWKIARGFAGAARVLRARRPDFVFGVGGYASVPVAAAAWCAGIPLFIQEQNSVPGRANRMLGRAAKRVYAGFSSAQAWFPKGRVEVTGNPVRREIIAAAAEAAAAPAPAGPFTVFAMGGSRGARAINALALAVARRARRAGRAMRVLHQTGREEYPAVREAVEREGLPVEPFPFTERIAEPFSRCHAVLMRAGALSVAEAALFGKPCVLVPYPYAADRHQEKNAQEFCASGAGVWMRQEDATEESVFAALCTYADDPAAARAARDGCLRFARPGAADAIMRSALALLGAGKGARRV